MRYGRYGDARRSVTGVGALPGRYGDAISNPRLPTPPGRHIKPPVTGRATGEQPDHASDHVAGALSHARGRGLMPHWDLIWRPRTRIPVIPLP